MEIRCVDRIAKQEMRKKRLDLRMVMRVLCSEPSDVSWELNERRAL